MRLGEPCDRLASAVAPLLASRDSTLGGFQGALRLAIPTGMKDACPIGKGSECLYPKINARLVTSEGQRLCRHIHAGEAHIPTVRFSTDRNGLDCSLHRARPPYSNTSDLG